MYDFKEELNKIKESGLHRKLLPVSSGSAPKIMVNGKEVIMLASNDYLGFCSHPEIKIKARDAIEKWGAGSGAARLISGNLTLFDELEKRIATFKNTEDALVFSTGYMANAGLLSALGTKEDLIYSDELNHASIIDGCRLSRAKIKIYPHKDVKTLESFLKQESGYQNRIIVTDGVFSMDGDIAPVPDLLLLAEKYDATLIIDDAHGTGAIGKSGKGTLEHFEMENSSRTIILGTMGKAMGSFGAFVAGTKELKEYLINKSRSFIFTTALPPSVPAASIQALNIIEKKPAIISELKENASYMRKGLRSLGFNTLESETQIMPVMIGSPADTVNMAKELFDKGLFIQAIRPPTVPESSSRLRLTVMATHEKSDLEKALSILEKTGKKFGII
jgi:8-amino-7-oxononanoate synthase